MPKYFQMKAQSETKAEIWIFGFIGNSIWDDVNPQDFISELKSFGAVDEIELHVNSEGGSVIGGNVIYNALKNHKAKVKVIVEGMAASMASVIAMAGDEVVMADNAMMMIHDPWSWAQGNAEEFRKAADVLDKTKESLIGAYKKKTGLEEDEISDLMSEETWMTAKEAVQWGFADSVGDEIDMAACIKGLDLSNFKSFPGVKSKASAPTDNQKGEDEMPKPKVEGDAQNKGAADKTVDVQAAVKEALAKEEQRKSEIVAVFAAFPEHSDLEKECLMDSSFGQKEAQEKLLAKIGSSKVEPLGNDIQIIDKRDKMKEGFAKALLSRSGFAKDDTSNEFRGYSLSEMARMSLEKAGINTRRMDRMQMVGSAFTHTTSDFPNILEDVMHKSMLKGWDEAPETFQQWTTKGSLSDFRPTSRVDINAFGSLTQVDEGAEYTYGTVGDRKETTQLATYGKLVNVTRQAIINDDLRALTKIPVKMGRAARRTIGNLVYAILTSNPNMQDGTALFHADHKNLGTAGSLATGTIDELRSLMARQTDADAVNAAVSGALGISPSFLIVPETLRGQAIITMESETEIASSQNNSKKPNKVRNIAGVISDARLDSTSTTAYYLVANPALYDTIEVSYLDGVEAPFLEQKMGWSIDGTEYKVRIDAGVKALDFRTMAKNAGA